MNILSLKFLVVFFCIFLGYWSFAKKREIQNLILLLSSYAIYSTWNIKASVLLLLVSLLSYIIALLFRNDRPYSNKLLLWFNIAVNIGILFTFKYYDFFAAELCKFLDLPSNEILLRLILPVGISFYIFTTTGYVIDVYKCKRSAETNIIDYLAFISFFPLIMSGPIERSTTLLPQFKHERKFNYSFAVDGAQQVLWGLFKKLVIADNCASVVNFVFPNYDSLPSSALIIGAVLYSFQIYFDFSGYSDIAIGFSKLLGFRVLRNFNYPYFAINISDFWRRWHMSLQRWFTDYIYFPLGGSRCSIYRSIFNTFVVFIVCGIWHGANWTFIVWGLYNALLFVPYIVFFKGKSKKYIANEQELPSKKDVFNIFITFTSVTIGWILFNSYSLGHGLGYIVKCFDVNTLFDAPYGIGLSSIYLTCCLLFVVIILEWLNKDKEYALQFKAPKYLKITLYYVLVALLIFNRAGAADFIYLQF